MNKFLSDLSKYIIDKNGRITNTAELLQRIKTSGLPKDIISNLEILISTNDYYSLVRYLRITLSEKKRFTVIIKNVNKIKYAAITNEDISVLVGYNNEGKSTILKSIYYIISLYSTSNIYKLDRYERSELDLFINSTFKPNSKCSEDNTSIYSLMFRKDNLLKGVFTSLEDDWEISLKIDDIYLKVSKDEVYMNKPYKPNSPTLDVTYISSCQILNYLQSPKDGINAEQYGLSANGAVASYDRDLLTKLLPRDNTKSNPIVYSTRFYMMDNGNQYIPNEVGDGIKLRAIIQTLVYNKVINNPDSLLLIDEPEISLHSQSLVALLKAISNLRCHNIISTHSTDVLSVLNRYNPNAYLIFNRESSNVDIDECMEHLTRPIVGEIGVYGL